MPHSGVAFSKTFGSALATRAGTHARGVRSAGRHPTFGRGLTKTNCRKTSAKYSRALTCNCLRIPPPFAPRWRPPSGHQVVTRPKIEQDPTRRTIINPRPLTAPVSSTKTATAIRHGFAFRYAVHSHRQPTSPPPLFHDIQQLHIEN